MAIVSILEQFVEIPAEFILGSIGASSGVGIYGFENSLEIVGWLYLLCILFGESAWRMPTIGEWSGRMS